MASAMTSATAIPLPPVTTRFRRVLITGASDPGSIGYAVVVELLSRGLVSDEVIVSARDAPKVAAAVTLLQELADKSSVRIAGAVGDLSQPSTMKDLIKNAAGDDKNSIDLLVVSGGNGGSEYLGIDATSDMAGYHLLYDVAVVSPMVLATTAVEQYGTTSVVFVSSLAADLAWPDTLPYNLAKAAQNALTTNLAFRYRATARINAVLPGCIHSSKLNIMAEKKGQSVESYAQLRAACHPLGRNGTVMEVAQAVLSMATNSFLTGVLLPVDGGLSLTNWFNRPQLLAEYQGNNANET
jgi:NAD(P)-dependent dehydrogenase (short-subunit alcohol dehydrogenase family)